MKNFVSILFLMALCIGLSSCEFLLGSKEDDQTEEIFVQGSIDPTLVQNEVGYVPVLPFWTNFDAPLDVYVGYDEMVYVIDANGLNVLDQTGTIQKQVFIPGATDVIQDRRLHTYVTGRVDVDVDGDGSAENLAAVYHLMNTAVAGEVLFLDTLIHPFSDVSRNNSAFRGMDDLAVEFTGLATLADNTLYVARSGPRNDLASIARPDHAVLFYDEEGENIGYANGLNPVSSSLKSTLYMSAIATEAGPPQAVNGISGSGDFMLLQTAPEAEFKALHILKQVDAETGTSYVEDAVFASMNPDKADRFMYEPFRFENPADVYIAPDNIGYIFVVDADLDSLYQFTPIGFEGVNPPPTSTTTKQIIASFGGEGGGPFEFIEPSGVCYFEETVFVADKGNGRICRYKLSTDIE